MTKIEYDLGLEDVDMIYFCFISCSLYEECHEAVRPGVGPRSYLQLLSVERLLCVIFKVQQYCYFWYVLTMISNLSMPIDIN